MDDMYFMSAAFAHTKAKDVSELRSIQELLELMYVEIYLPRANMYGEVQEVIHDLAHNFYESLIYGSGINAEIDLDTNQPYEVIQDNVARMRDLILNETIDPSWSRMVYDEIYSQLYAFIEKTLEYKGIVSDIRHTPISMSSGLMTVYVDLSYA